MLAYAIRRLLIAIPVILVSTVVVFLLVSLSGDPLADLKARNPRPPESVFKLREHQLRLDQSLPERYWHWLTGLFHGDFGPSVQTNLDIGHEVLHRLFVTARLVALAMIIAAILAVIVGVLSAVKQYSVADYSFTFVGFLCLSLPVFWFALLLKEGGIWLNKQVGHTVIYTLGDKSVTGVNGAWDEFTDILGHLVLPTITLALVSFAAWSRYNRASMLEVLESDYLRLARSKGLSRGRVLIRHALRTALIPLVTVMGLDLAAIFSGAIVTEKVFQWHGMGDFLLTEISYHDVYGVLAWLLVVGVIVIVFNLITDLLYAVLDPRIRYD